jgi:hypothetical protein
MNNVKHKIPFSLVKTASLIGSVVEVDVRVDVSGCLISPAAGMVRTIKNAFLKGKLHKSTSCNHHHWSPP